VRSRLIEDAEFLVVTVILIIHLILYFCMNNDICICYCNLTYIGFIGWSSSYYIELHGDNNVLRQSKFVIYYTEMNFVSGHI